MNNSTQNQMLLNITMARAG